MKTDNLAETELLLSIITGTMKNVQYRLNALTRDDLLAKKDNKELSKQLDQIVHLLVDFRINVSDCTKDKRDDGHIVYVPIPNKSR